jgi:large conductance mechanosensitive channel
MGWIKEFKDFAMKGNVVDLAVGIIIGSAFGKIVSSLVADVIMPPIGLLIGGVKFTDLKIKLNPNALDPTGILKVDPVTINIGNFLQVSFDFIIIAFAIFMIVKVMNSMQKKEVAAPSEPPAQPADVVLLTEIRDLLKNRK